jgi:hypothetical protein
MSSNSSRERTLQREIAQLVVERQDLRASGASDDTLEENRVELAKRQRDLSQLLIDLYLPKPARSAA